MVEAYDRVTIIFLAMVICSSAHYLLNVLEIPPPAQRAGDPLKTRMRETTTVIKRAALLTSILLSKILVVRHARHSGRPSPHDLTLAPWPGWKSKLT